jgi:hypothetical protein
VARELHTNATRQSCGSKAGNQARRHDGAPERRRRKTEKSSRREERDKVAAVVLTLGRRCSRGRPVGGVASVFRAVKAFPAVQMSPVVLVFTPANVLRSSGPCSRSWFTASSSSGAARDAARSSPGTSSAHRCGRVLPWAGAAAAPSPAPFHGALTDGVERENPNGVGGGGQLALCLPLLAFEPPAPLGQGEIPTLPRLGLPGRPWRRRLLSLRGRGHRGKARG